MAVFGGMTLTQKGIVLQSKTQTGTQIKYTRMAAGDGSLTGQSIPALNGLISPKMNLPIQSVRLQPPNKAVVGVKFSNQDVTAGFFHREMGLFAEDPDVGEILYAYANSGVTADYIPAGGDGGDIIEKVFNVAVAVGTTANITAVIDDSLVFVQQKKFDVHKHTGGAGDAPKIGSDGLAAGAVNDAAIGDRTISDTTAPTGNVGKLGSLLGWIANRIKAITGKAKWTDAPAINLETVASRLDQDVRTTASPKFQKVTAGASGMTVNLPTDAGSGSSWARGYELWNSAGSTRLGGFGALGGSDAVSVLFFGHGQNPWSDGNGIYIKTNGYVGVKTTNPANELDVNGWVKAKRYISDIATGTAPFQIASTTQVDNLNVHYLQGMQPRADNVNSTIVSRNSTGQSAFSFIYLNNATGTAPFSVSPGSTKVADLIADAVDGYHLDQGVQTTDTPTFKGVVASNAANAAANIRLDFQNNTTSRLRIGGTGDGSAANFEVQGIADKMLMNISQAGNLTVPGRFISTQATGTAPLEVNSTTTVRNLSADLLDGKQGNDYAQTASVAGVTSLAAVTQAGMYRLGGPTQHTDMPATHYAYASMIVARGGGADTAAQIILPYNSNDIVWRRGNPTEVGGSGTYSGWMKIWNEGNDGAGSGLDADMLDNLHASDFQRSLLVDNYKTAADLPSTYPKGITTFFANNAANGWPSNEKYGTVMTIKGYATSPAGIQYFYPYLTDQPIKYRMATHGTDAWTEWRVILDSSQKWPTFDTVNTTSANILHNTRPGMKTLIMHRADDGTLHIARSATNGGTDWNWNADVYFAENGMVSAPTFSSRVATGTAPFTVASTTRVSNLNAHYVGGVDIGNILHANQTQLQFDATTAEKSLQWLYATGKAFGIAANKDALSLWDWGNARSILQYYPAANLLQSKVNTTRIGSGLELLGQDQGSAYLDFNSKNNGADFDARIIATGGNATNVAGGGELEVFAKQMVVNGYLWLGRNGAGTPNCTLTLGDSDTGINWTGDGRYQLRANNQVAASIDASGVSVPATTSYGSSYVRNTIISTAAPSAGAGVDGDIWVQYV
ncbi:phage tail protein [Paenibacillus sp. CN-4]|uniref:phage tail-collar fiber domain-containing protein n=1 Tax=Paenibacillus nanchangensis TaxID=3348343 RepID=UPI003978DCB1